MFRSLICGHHVYKKWSPYTGEKLTAHPDYREEALKYDKYEIGIHQEEKSISHLPVEISSLLYHFLGAGDGNYNEVEIIGERGVKLD